jgi:hypothetical protein
LEEAIRSSNTLLKTAVAAVVATVIFAIAAFKIAGWTRSLSPNNLDAEGNRTTVSAAAATPPAGSTTRVIPQVAIGSFDGRMTTYSTIVEVVNAGTSDGVVDATFYKEDGDLSPVAMTTNLRTPASFTGNSGSLIIPAGQVLVVSGGTTPASTPSSGLIGWGKLITTGDLTISTFFEVRDARSDMVLSRIGIAASRPDLLKFLVPRVHTKGGLDVAFALVNTGSMPASITATLKDAVGKTVAKRSVSMNPGTHQALFAHQLFSLPNEPDDRSYGYIIFNADSPSFAAIALAFEAGTQTSFPVEPLQ